MCYQKGSGECSNDLYNNDSRMGITVSLEKIKWAKLQEHLNVYGLPSLIIEVLVWILRGVYDTMLW